MFSKALTSKAYITPLWNLVSSFPNSSVVMQRVFNPELIVSVLSATKATGIFENLVVWRKGFESTAMLSLHFFSLFSTFSEIFKSYSYYMNAYRNDFVSAMSKVIITPWYTYSLMYFERNSSLIFILSIEQVLSFNSEVQGSHKQSFTSSAALPIPSL